MEKGGGVIWIQQQSAPGGNTDPVMGAGRTEEGNITPVVG